MVLSHGLGMSLSPLQLQVAGTEDSHPKVPLHNWGSSDFDFLD